MGKKAEKERLFLSVGFTIQICNIPKKICKKRLCNK